MGFDAEHWGSHYDVSDRRGFHRGDISWKLYGLSLLMEAEIVACLEICRSRIWFRNGLALLLHVECLSWKWSVILNF